MESCPVALTSAVFSLAGGGTVSMTLLFSVRLEMTSGHLEVFRRNVRCKPIHLHVTLEGRLNGDNLLRLCWRSAKAIKSTIQCFESCLDRELEFINPSYQ